MARASIRSVRISGVASAVPVGRHTTEDLSALFGAEEARKIAESSGVDVRRVVRPETCTSDLCIRAAEALLTEMPVKPEDIDGLVFVSQTPDFTVPATSCDIHGRMGLSKGCATFDVTLGCSGYTYGLWLASSMIATGTCSKVLLLAGDTSTRTISPFDRSTLPLFGDAGSATMIERDDSAPPIHFVLGTDGTGSKHLIRNASGFRHQRNENTFVRTEREGGILRHEDELYMNGPEIFTFTLREVPSLVNTTLEAAGWSRDDVDAYVFHQANRFMLAHLAKKMKLPTDKVILALKEFGNTSSASIPLALTSELRDRLAGSPMNLVLAGFGVGFSWSSVAVAAPPMVMPPLVECDL